MNNHLVSIIIPTFNRAELIVETLESVFIQTYKNWECIIVDDHSTDNTSEIVNHFVEKDNRFQFYYRPKNRLKGANACRNYAFENSKGDYVIFLDSDDILADFCLEERIAKINEDKEIDVLIRDASLLIDGQKQFVTINKEPKSYTVENYLRMFLRYEVPWQTSSAFYKRKLIERCRFDENLKRFQDVSLNVKILSKIEQLKLVRDFKIDTYYRVDEAKVLLNNFVGNMLDSLIVFYEVHSQLINNPVYKGDLRKYSCKIILEFVIPYFDANKRESNELFRWSLKSKLYNCKQKAVLFQLLFLLNTGLFKQKNIGMNKFRDYFKKLINN